MTLPPNVYDAEAIPEAARAEIDRMLQSGDLFRYTAPEDAPVTLLEQEFADHLGSKYALAVSSCSAALFLSLKALGLPRDARVLIPGFTFAAVPSSVVHADCIPVLCEVGENYRIDIDDFTAKLDNVQAVIISHMRGHTSDMDAIMDLCTARDIPVIEDAAHSLGTTWAGRNIGTIGQVGCFSFQSYKLVNAGEGGIMVTDDADLIARAVIMSGAYEHNWSKHIRGGDNALRAAFATWQNRLPLYNLRAFAAAAAERGVKVQVFGLSTDNARAFWNWQFLPEAPGDLPRTRAMLMRACDARLPARLTRPELDLIADALVQAANDVMGEALAYGT